MSETRPDAGTPTRLPDEALARLRKALRQCAGGPLPVPYVALTIEEYDAVLALVEEVQRLRASLDSIIIELRDMDRDDDRLARVVTLAKAVEARDAS